MTNCVVWSTIDDNILRPNCTNYLRRESQQLGGNMNGRSNCHLCESPKTDPAPITTCSNIILPDVNKAWYLTAEGVSSPTLTPVAVGPLHTNVITSPLSLRCRAPVTSCVEYPQSYNGFSEQWYNTVCDPGVVPEWTQGIGGTWNIAGLPSKKIIPGAQEFRGNRVYCEWGADFMSTHSLGYTRILPFTFESTASELPGYTSFPYRPPVSFVKKYTGYHTFSWNARIMYGAYTQYTISGYNWNSPTTRYYIIVRFVLQRASGMMGDAQYGTSAGLWTYLNRTGNGNITPPFGPPTPWGWASNTNITGPLNQGTLPFADLMPYIVQHDMQYTYETASKTEFMSKDKFKLVLDPTPLYASLPPLSSPTSAPVLSNERTLVFYDSESEEFYNLESYQLAYNDPTPTSGVFQFASSMISGWPETIMVRRTSIP